MHYHIARDGQQLGQFSEEELNAGLFDGRYLTTDLAWREGMAEWRPLGEIMGQGVTVLRQSTGTGMRSPAGGGAPAPGTAVASLVLGIVSLLTCWLGFVFAVPGIICGHLALSRIRESGGTMGGRGMALAGLIMSYVAPVLMIIAIFASLGMGAIGKVAEKGEVTKGMSMARQVAVAASQYATDHDGKYPSTLEELISSGVLEDRGFLLKFASFKPAGWQGAPGFEYRGMGMTDSDPGSKVLLISNCQDRTDKRIIVTKDSAAQLQKPASP
jgi:hypothetical protein